LLLRQIVGRSMHPHFPEGKVVIANGWFRRLQPRDVVIIMHDGIEKIKRIEQVRPREVYVLGDNVEASTDSRDFGWIASELIRGKVVWPRID